MFSVDSAAGSTNRIFSLVRENTNQLESHGIRRNWPLHARITIHTLAHKTPAGSNHQNTKTNKQSTAPKGTQVKIHTNNKHGSSLNAREQIFSLYQGLASDSCYNLNITLNNQGVATWLVKLLSLPLPPHGLDTQKYLRDIIERILQSVSVLNMKCRTAATGTADCVFQNQKIELLKCLLCSLPQNQA